MSRRNIYQPGKQTNTRILENFEDVSNLIINFGFEELFSDEIKNLNERINIFKNIDILICELGAGMHNLLYCKNGITVYVMCQKNNISWLQEYYPLFKQKNMKIYLLKGDSTSQNHNGNWLNTPWKLNIDYLKSGLKNTLNNK